MATSNTTTLEEARAAKPKAAALLSALPVVGIGITRIGGGYGLKVNLSESVAGKLTGIEQWATKNNPFFEGPFSDLLGLIPLLILTVVLYLVGRELLLKPKPYAQVRT